MRGFRFAFWIFGAVRTVAVLFLSALAAAQAVAPPASPPAGQVVLPDGTPVYLRFARPLHGSASACPAPLIPFKRCDPALEVKKGEQIRLIVASEVVVNGQVVIAKGAVAQAHVHNTYLVSRQPPTSHVPHAGRFDPYDPGFTLMLDWVETVTAEKVPLRAVKTGAPHWFNLRIISRREGVDVVRTDALHTIVSMYALFSRDNFHGKDWIPTGARLTAYTHGNAEFSGAQIAEAQSLLPFRSNLLSVVTVFRTSDGKDLVHEVYLGWKDKGSLKAKSYLTMELPAGEYRLRADTGDAYEFTVEAGRDMFIELHHRGFTGSLEFREVPDSVGEDAISKAEYVPCPQTY